ncbi:MAG TPA: hypothetical protein VGX70_05025 [Gemmataceae bacterium]|nr:hypothetical protein [Gemmataceae bacterium]
MGNPELWAEILDRMAGDESILNIRSALAESLVYLLPDAETRKLVEAYSFNAMMGAEALATQSLSEMNKRAMNEAIIRFVRHRIVQVLLAAEEIATDLAGNSPHVRLGLQLPREVVIEVANQIQSDSKCIEGLQKVISKGKPELLPMAVSIMHRVDSTWILQTIRESMAPDSAVMKQSTVSKPQAMGRASLAVPRSQPAFPDHWSSRREPIQHPRIARGVREAG